MSNAHERSTSSAAGATAQAAPPSAPSVTPSLPTAPAKNASGGYSALLIFFGLFVAGSAIPAIVTSGVSTDDFQIWIEADGCHALSAPRFGTSLTSLCYATNSVLFPGNSAGMRCVPCACPVPAFAAATLTASTCTSCCTVAARQAPVAAVMLTRWHAVRRS